jgi:electron transport complex, rnfABCDGE type, D subunit
MAEFYNVSSSPHVRATSSTKDIMRDVLIAMLPAAAFGVWNFGFYSLAVIILTVAAAVATEYVYCKVAKKPISIGDYSAAVTGMILALNMPPQIPVWIPILGAIFAIVVVKQLYGGLGQNWMNPALAARCFLLISFAGKMTDFTSKKLGFDSLSTPTPLAALKATAAVSGATVSATSGATATAGSNTFYNLYNLNKLFIGTIPGTIGEVSVIALLIGAVYLLARKVISFEIPVTYILTVAIFVFIFGEHNIYFVLGHLFAGGLIFGAFFMATDYATRPITKLGQILFAVFIGILTGLFRLFGGSAEGVSYAIIIGNIVVPLLERVTIPKAFGRRKKAA